MFYADILQSVTDPDQFYRGHTSNLKQRLGDGRLLSFDCNGLQTVVAATGTAWPARYQLSIAAIADALPIRLKLPEVEVGIWKSMLEIDRVRCPGAVRLTDNLTHT